MLNVNVKVLKAVKQFFDSAEEPKEKKYPFKFRDKLTRDQYARLRASIKGKAAMSRGLREEACASHGDERWYLRKMKRDQAWDVRLDLLCLAVLKGRRYRDVEPNSDPDFRPDANDLADRLGWMVTRTYREQGMEHDLKSFFEEVE